MKIENTQSQMRKGVLEYCILSIIKRSEAYPGDIIEEMHCAGLQLLEGTLYPLLNRLTRIIHEEHFPFSLPLFSSVG